MPNCCLVIRNSCLGGVTSFLGKHSGPKKKSRAISVYFIIFIEAFTNSTENLQAFFSKRQIPLDPGSLICGL